MVVMYVVGAVVLVVWLLRQLSASVYDVVIVHMTKLWYKVVLEKLEPQTTVLDVGIGTATALLRNKDLILSKDLKVVGIDYDQSYINAAVKSVQQNELESKVTLLCKSIFDPDLQTAVLQNTPEGFSGKLFDVVYFSGSWSLMPSPVEALRVMSRLCKDDGVIYITQTFQKQHSPIMYYLKPMLKYITTIDFGQLHLVTDMEGYLKEAEVDRDGVKFNVVTKEVIPGSINNRFQAAYMIALKKVVTVEQATQRR